MAWAGAGKRGARAQAPRIAAQGALRGAPAAGRRRPCSGHGIGADRRQAPDRAGRRRPRATGAALMWGAAVRGAAAASARPHGAGIRACRRRGPPPRLLLPASGAVA